MSFFETTNDKYVFPINLLTYETLLADAEWNFTYKIYGGESHRSGGIVYYKDYRADMPGCHPHNNFIRHNPFPCRWSFRGAHSFETREWSFRGAHSFETREVNAPWVSQQCNATCGLDIQLLHCSQSEDFNYYCVISAYDGRGSWGTNPPASTEYGSQIVYLELPYMEGIQIPTYSHWLPPWKDLPDFYENRIDEMRLSFITSK